MSKTFMRSPIFWIPSLTILLDWITKLYFNITLDNPEIFKEPNLIKQCFVSIAAVFKLFPKILQGDKFKVNIYTCLGYSYGNTADRIAAALLIFLMILSLWVLYKCHKTNFIWKYLYCIFAGSILANTLEVIIFGRVIDWLCIDLYVQTKITNIFSSWYDEAIIMNLADAILHIFLPLTILFYLGHIVRGRKVKNEKNA